MDNLKQKPWYRLGNLDITTAMNKDLDLSFVEFNNPSSFLEISREKLLNDLLDPEWVDQVQSQGIISFKEELTHGLLFWRQGDMAKLDFSKVMQIHVDSYNKKEFMVHHYGVNWTLDYLPFWDGWRSYYDTDTITDIGTMYWYDNKNFDLKPGSYDHDTNMVQSPLSYITLNIPKEEIKSLPRPELLRILDLEDSDVSTEELINTAVSTEHLIGPRTPDHSVDIGKDSLPTLICPSMPHQAFNHTPRLTLSLRGLISSDNGSMLWDSVIEHFKPLITE